MLSNKTIFTLSSGIDSYPNLDTDTHQTSRQTDIMGAVTEIPHPFDPPTLSEIETAINTVKKAHGTDLYFNVVSLYEPRKAEMTAWLAAPETAPRPARIADVVVIAPGNKVYDALVELADPKITKWQLLEGEQPIA